MLVHNHPSGNPEPSMADRHMTQTIKQALALIDVHLLDHFIVAGSKTVSMSELGQI
jgi:DNA repair protein RadC